MLFISKYPFYTFTLDPGAETRHPRTGEVIGFERDVQAQFLPLVRAPGWVQAAARNGLVGSEGLRPVYEQEDVARDASDRPPMMRLVRDNDQRHMPLHEVAAPLVDDGRLLGWFDTDMAAADVGWPADRKHEYEQKMLRQSGPTSFVPVTPPKPTPPWPTYDALVARGRRSAANVAERIVETIAATGVHPDAVLAYERETLNRPEVVEALEALLATPAAAVEDEEMVEA